MTTSNDEIAVLLAAISKQMTQQGQLIRKMWVEMTGLAPTADDLKPKKEMPKKDLIITDDPNHGHVIDDIPKGNYVRYTDKHWELKAAPEIETEKGIKLYIDDLKEGFWFPKMAFEDKKFQIGLVKWYRVQKWVLEKNGLIAEGS